MVVDGVSYLADLDLGHVSGSDGSSWETSFVFMPLVLEEKDIVKLGDVVLFSRGVYLKVSKMD